MAASCRRVKAAGSHLASRLEAGAPRPRRFPRRDRRRREGASNNVAPGSAGGTDTRNTSGRAGGRHNRKSRFPRNDCMQSHRVALPSGAHSRAEDRVRLRSAEAPRIGAIYVAQCVSVGIADSGQVSRGAATSTREYRDVAAPRLMLGRRFPKAHALGHVDCAAPRQLEHDTHAYVFTPLRGNSPLSTPCTLPTYASRRPATTT